LPSHHRYKKNINDFLKGKTERNVPPSVLLYKKLYDVVLRQSMNAKKKKKEAGGPHGKV